MSRNIVTLDDLERRHFIEYGDRIQEWHKQLVTLSTGGLTLLVSFQKNYVPEEAECLYLIKICWASLAICICFGLLVFFGHAQTRLDATNDLRRKRRNWGEATTVQFLKKTGGVNFVERSIFSMARVFLPLSFLVALVCLVWFAVLNVGK
jgi:hypothetical protein